VKTPHLDRLLPWNWKTEQTLRQKPTARAPPDQSLSLCRPHPRAHHSDRQGGGWRPLTLKLMTLTQRTSAKGTTYLMERLTGAAPCYARSSAPPSPWYAT